jgi:hypothetical protein
MGENDLCVCKLDVVAQGGVVVIVLAIGLKIHGFKPGLGRWNKNSYHDFLRRGTKPSVPCYKIYGRLKNPASMEEILRRQNSVAIFGQGSRVSLLDVFAGYY